MTVSVVSNFDQEQVNSSWEHDLEMQQTPCCDHEVDMKFATPPTRRSVRFSADLVSECHNVEHINDFSDEEVENSWYSNREYQRIRKEYHDTVQLMKSNKWDENQHCFRGLERKTEEGARRRDVSKISSVGAVLREQHRQILLGIPDERAIARAYVCETHMAKDYAREKAIADEREARGLPKTANLGVTQNNTRGHFPRKSFQLKRVLVGGRRRVGVLDELIALTTSPALTVDTTSRAA